MSMKKRVMITSNLGACWKRVVKSPSWWRILLGGGRESGKDTRWRSSLVLGWCDQVSK